MCPYVRNTRYYGLVHDDLYRPETREKPINGCERAERASRNFCTFASETYVFLYRPENQKLEKKLYMIASKPFFLCVCLKHAILLNILLVNHNSLSVQCVLLFVTLVIWSYSWRFIPTRNVPETREKPINGYERAERASRNFCTFAWLRQKRIWFFLTDRKTRN